MLEVQIFLAILDQVRGEGILMAEQPSFDKQTAFGFGEASGIMKACNRIREIMNEQIEKSREAN